MMRTEIESVFGQNESSKFTFIILKNKLPCFWAILECGMDTRDRNIIRYFDINILFPTNVDPIFVTESDELEDLAILLSFLLHDLKYDVRFFRLWNIDCVKLLVVEIDTIFVVGLTHLTKKRLPVDCHTEIIYACLYLLRKPGLQTKQVDVPHCP